MITLTLKQRPHVPLEAEAITPDVVAPLSNDAIRALPVALGKRRYRVDDFFDVDGAGGDEITIHGDVGRVKWLGRGMTRGTITIHGNAGMHLGSYMKGGVIEVTGNVSDWIGGEMAGGLIRVTGNAGGQIGAAYRGSMSGMSGGTLFIGGHAGLEIGMRMKRGVIVIGGPVKDFAGLQMKGGTIFLMSGAELRTGAAMSRGTIVSMRPLKLLPTFAYGCDYNPPFLAMYARGLREIGVTIPFRESEGTYRRYTGDAAIPGKGELLIWQPRG